MSTEYLDAANTSELIEDLEKKSDWDGTEFDPNIFIDKVGNLPINTQVEIIDGLLERWVTNVDEAEGNRLKIVITAIWDRWWFTRPQAVLDKVLGALNKDNQGQNTYFARDVRRAAADWLGSNAEAIAEDDRRLRKVLDALVHSANEDLISEVRISAWNAAKKIGEASWETYPQAVFSSVLKALKDIEEGDDWKARQAAADWLEEKAADIAVSDRMVSQALVALIDSTKDDQDPVFLRSALKASKAIWEQGWESRRQDVLDQVLETLKQVDDIDDIDIRHAALIWLKGKSRDIAEDDRMFEQSLTVLLECSNSDQDPVINRSARDAITEIWNEGWFYLDRLRGIDNDYDRLESGDTIEIHRLAVLSEVLKALAKENDWEVKQMAADWLGGKARDIAQSNRMVSDTLKELIDSAINATNDHFRRSAWDASREIMEAGWEKRDAGSQFSKQVVLEQVLFALRKCGDEKDSEIRQIASDWLGKKASDIVKEERMLKDSLSALVECAKLDKVDYVRMSAWTASQKIWEAGWEVEGVEENHRQFVLDQVLMALRTGEDSEDTDWEVSDSSAEIRSEAAEWLGGKADQIAADDRMVNQTMKALLRRLTKDGERISVSRSAWETCKKIWIKGWDDDDSIQNTRRSSIFSHFLKVLSASSESEIRQAAADWLGDKATEITQENLMIDQAVKELLRRVNRDGSLEVKRSAWEASKKLWIKSWGREVNIEEGQRLAILSQFLTVLDKSQDLEFRQAVVNWLGEKASDIAKSYDMTEKSTDALDRIRKRDYIEDELVESANRSLVALWEALHKEIDLESIKKKFESQSENQKIVNIRRLANKNTLGSRDAVAFLVNKWVDWICQEIEPRLVELTSEALRDNEHAVLPLVEHFIKNWDTPQRDFRLNIREAISGGSPISLLSQKDMDQETRLENQLRVRRRIAKQLADMSDQRFFDTPELGFKYASILQELKDHAVPALVRRLPEEKDVEILENMSRTLLYTREREAVDALIKEIIGEERTRRARQDLLAQYYLEPSKRRSEQAAEILNKAIRESKRTLRLLQYLNITVVVVGLAILFGGVLLSMRSEDAAQRVIGGLAAMGGLAGVVYQLIRDPLNRIQNANSKLVQMETAFTSFIWELNLNGTFIQSSYVDSGILADDEIEATIDRIENAMELTMKLVSIHTEEGGQRLVTRLNKLEPAAGEMDCLVTIFGQHLLGDETQKSASTRGLSLNQGEIFKGIVAINHTPIDGGRTEWKSNQVEFKLPKSINGKPLGETVWVSLFVDGMETNALPFRVINSES